MVTISVIVPVYRVEQFVANSIKSLLAQTFTLYEIILVDNNSDDKSIEIAVRILSEANARFKIVKEKKQGLACAKNAGIRNASGEWVICVDPDDVVAPDFLDVLYNNALKSKTKVSFANYQIVNEDNLFKPHDSIIRTRNIEKKEIINLFLKRKINVIVPSMLIKREFYMSCQEAWNNESMQTGEDAYHLWIVFTRFDRIAYCDTPLYNYYVRPNSLTTSYNTNKSVSCHVGFNELKHYIIPVLGAKMADQISARNDFALIRVAAIFGSFDDYSIVRKTLCDDEYYKVLKKFPDIRVRLLNMFNKYSPKIFYKINHR